VVDDVLVAIENHLFSLSPMVGKES
jgi:hypothetical protein